MIVSECLGLSLNLEGMSDSARLDTELLLAEALGKSRTWLYTWPEARINEQQHKQFVAFMERRAKGEPVAYILGTQAFWSLDLKVNSSTLIPRPETELLVELALTKIADTNTNILDLGTGTGAIALAIAKERPNCRVIGVDKQKLAIELANENAALNGIDKVEFLQSDWFAALKDIKFSLIVGNPPYVDKSDPLLRQGDVKHEPESALIADNRGYADIQYIVEHVPGWLENGAYLMLEHGWQQAEKVRSLFATANYKNIETHKDLSGNERVTFGQALK